MKTLFFSILICALVIGASDHLKINREPSKNTKKLLIQEPMTEKYLYTNEKYKYQVLVPAGFEIEDDLPELVSIENMDMRLRINVGCLDSGIGNMQPVVEPINLNGIPALKEDYYDEVALRLRRTTFHLEDRECFAIEEVAQTEQEWQDLQQIRKTFRFID